MSLLDDFNINTRSMAKYSPLSQLSEKYLSQVLKKSRVLTFDAGEQIFDKQHKLEDMYFLLKGKLKVKAGLLSSEVLDAETPDCLNPINSKIPNGKGVKASEAGHMLLIEKEFLDRALGWTVAEQEKKAKAEQEALNSQSQLSPAGEFDEEHFTWITSLMDFPLFFNLPPSNMELLLTKFEKVPVANEEVVIKEGDDGDYFYLLMKGSARVIIGQDETRPIRLNRGSYFGEEALISDTVRSATVIMNEDGVLARLDKESFQSLLNDPLVDHISRASYREEIQNSSTHELLDIRSLAEFDHIPLPQCLHIPLEDLRQKLPELDKNKTYYLTEEGGYRSDVAAHILCQNSIKAKVIRN